MMSEYYDHYHRWQPLAEFHFYIDENEELYDDNYVYCLCSRASIRDGVKTYYAEKEYCSESDAELVQDSHSQDIDDHSHVHFSIGTSYKVKCEKDEGASCYCSASHTDNYCSTDELDLAQMQGFSSHALQPSDSGADLTYQDCHSDYTTLDKIEKMEQDFLAETTNENYLSEHTWEQFWAVNGERIIWASWIKKYSEYINPEYLNENNDLSMDEYNVPKKYSVDPVCNIGVIDSKEKHNHENVRERKFSYDSKVNPYKKGHEEENLHDKNNKTVESMNNKDDIWLPVHRRRSCSEHERIVSPRTLAGTDSMTNVTKLTLSSYNVTSSHVTSESTPTDDYSVTSTSSDDQFNDQTRIVNIDYNTEQLPSEDLDTEDYWQFLWKQHFGEQYALHFANYLECHKLECIPVENKIEELKALDVECENSEGNSQELPSVIEVQTQINEIKLDDKPTKLKRKNKKSSNRIISSVGMLLQNLLKEQKEKNVEELVEGGDEDVNSDKAERVTIENIDDKIQTYNVQQSNSSMSNQDYDDGDDDPPEETPVSLKRSHELDDEEEEDSEKIKGTLQIMGYSVNPSKIPKGLLIYRKRLMKLRPPRNRRHTIPKKTYFDDDGNAYYSEQNQESQDDREMLTDDEDHEIQSDAEQPQTYEHNAEEVSIIDKEEENTENITRNENESDIGESVESMHNLDAFVGDAQENKDNEKADSTVIEHTGQIRKRRRQKRYSKIEECCEKSDVPDEIKNEPKMYKYWKKRHSLFHRFDEGIKLDRESWFSVTPENVARHIATKCTYDVVIDAFCGAGGNTIQFAQTSKKVIAIDIDPNKIEMAKHNATVYGVADKIEFIVGDFFEIGPTLSADMVFLSPPWGGPKYSENHEYDIETMLEPKPASDLMKVALEITSNVTLYLPRNSKTDQILCLAQEAGGSVEIEQSYLDKRFVAITAYFY